MTPSTILKIFVAIFTLLILITIDYPVYKNIKDNVLLNKKKLFIIFKILYWTISATSYSMLIIYSIAKPYKIPADYSEIFIIINSIVFITFFFKIIVFLSIMIKCLVSLIMQVFKLNKTVIEKTKRTIVILGTSIADLIFIILFYNLFFSGQDIVVKRIEINLPDLPKSFDNYKIIQISDLHTGSYLNNKIMEDAVNIINKEKTDMIAFTGDIVNFQSSEMNEYLPYLKRFESKDGVFAVMGNHDYGEYVSWNTYKEKQDDVRNLIGNYNKISWNVLLNENRIIRKGDDSIAIIGSENWSNSKRFKSPGDLKKAKKGVEDVAFKILLSHDPQHFELKVIKENKDIQLTLSGHTHAMQFGIDNKYIKWSPSKWAYKYWNGLYKEGNQYIYVNRGLGYVGFASRIGMLPEITVITLKKSSQ